MIVTSVKHDFGSPTTLHELLQGALTGVSATGVGPVLSSLAPITFNLWITGTSGTITATVKIWGSNDLSCLTSQTNCSKILLGQSTALTGTGTGDGVPNASDALYVTANYLHYWAEVSAISGTGTKVFCNVVSS
jgi:hypothetical protein